MAEGQFTPDLLLTVGADVSALRQQLANISRELGIPPVNVQVEANVQQIREAQQSFNDLQRQIEAAKKSLSELKAQIAGGLYDVRLDKAATVAFQQNEELKRKEAQKTFDFMRGQEEKQAALQAKDVLTEGRAFAANEQFKRTEIEKTAIAQQRLGDANAALTARNFTGQLSQLSQIANAYEKIAALQIKASATGTVIPPQLQQRIGTFTSVLAGEQQGLLGGAEAASPQAAAALKATAESIQRDLKAIVGAAGDADGAVSGFFGKLGRYAQIAAGLTIIYTVMRQIGAAAEEFVEVDRQLAKIAATMDNGADRATVLRDSYDLMVQANQRLGVSFTEASKVVFELEKALGNNSEQVRAAFLPALTLASLGEGNQTEILRTLVGLYKLFGDTLTSAITPQEKYLQISDKLIGSAAASIQDIDGFRTALQNVAPVAKAAGVSLDVQLAAIVQLTNGMQSASRAGTGFRQLLVDLQTRPGAISKAFGIDFDPNAPLNATKLLDEVIKKIRDLGTDSLKTQALINSAFPDKRATLALETLVELYPQYSKALQDVADSAGRTQKAQEELNNTISAAAGRFKGALFNEITLTVNAISGVKPGQADGLVGLFDIVTRAAIIAGQELRKYLGDVKALIDAANRATGGAAGAATQGAAGSNITGSALLGFASPQAAYRGVLPPSQARLDAEAAAQAKQQQDLARANAQALQNAQNIELQPGDQSGQLKKMIDLTAELAKQKAILKNQIELEFTVNDKSLSYATRIAAADALLAEKTRERQIAEKNYDTTASLTPKDIAALDEYKGKLQTALEAERRARSQATELRREDANESIEISQKLAAQTEADQKKVVELFAKFTTEQSKLKEISPLERAVDEYKKLGDVLNSAQFAPLSPAQFSEINKMYIQIGEAINRYWVDPLLAITQLDYESGWDKFNKALKKNIEDAEKLRGITSAVTGKTAPTPEEVTQRSLERQVGVDAVTDQILKLRAEIGYTREEWIANIAAMKAGAKDFADLLRQINDESLPQADRDKKRAAATIITTKLLPQSDEATSLQIQKQTQDEQNRLDGLREGFGRVGEELNRYILARANWRKSYDDLTPKQQEEIDLLARTTEEMKNAAAAAGLVALGFSATDANSIAGQAGAVLERQKQIQDGINALKVLNDQQKVARDQQEQATQEIAKAAGQVGTYFVSALRQAANAAGDFFDDIKTLAQDTAKAMTSAFSDFFFNSFQDKLNAGKDAWKSFLDSMQRALADFMSKQLVKSFLNILTGTGDSGTGTGIPGAANLVSGVGSGFGNIVSNFQAGGLSAALFGLPPTTPSTVSTSPPGEPGAAGGPNSTSGVPRGTTGIVGSGGNISKDLSSAGAVAAAYTASQSVLKLTSELSTQRDRNSGTGGLAGTAVGGIIGSLFGATAIGAGAGGLIGSFLGGLFGSNTPPAGKFDELSRSISTVQTALEAAVKSSATFTDLYNTILGFQGGGALAAATRQPVQLAVGGQSVSNLTQEQFLTALRANPASLTASVQAGVSPDLLGPLNQEVVQTILAKVAALDDINRQISQTIAEISAEAVSPAATGIANLETLKEQAVNFRATVDQLIAGEQAQVASLESLLATTTDPAQILSYTTQIKKLIEDRYQNETQLVQQFAGQLDSLATSLKSVSKSIDDQIFQLQLSNFGPTNPLQGFQLAQGRFEAAKSAFQASPTPENAQALQALVDPLLKAASDVFTRPSPEYRAIYDEVIATLGDVKVSVDQQANDIQDALKAALGDSVSIQDLTQKNTASMASDMKSLLAIVSAQAAAAGINLNLGAGLLTGQNFPFPTGQVVAPTGPTPQGGNQTASTAAAFGVLGALGGGASLLGGAVSLSDKIGLTAWLQQTFPSIFGVKYNDTMLPGSGGAPGAGAGGVTVTNPQFALGSADFQSALASAMEAMNLQLTIPNINLNFGNLGSFSFSDLGSLDTNFSDIRAFQSGGHVPGMGVGDIVPAMLEPGEFVIPKKFAGPLRPWLEHLIGGNKSIPTGPRGLHFADGGTVPLTAQDVQALLLLQALLSVNSTQTQTQAQIAANTQLTAAILQQLAQRSGVSVNGAASPTTISIPSTPSVVGALGSPSATASAGGSGLTLQQFLTRLVASASGAGGTAGAHLPTTATAGGLITSSPSGGLASITGPGVPQGGGFLGPLGLAIQSGNPMAILKAASPLLGLLSTISTLSQATSGSGALLGGAPTTLGSLLGTLTGGLTLAGGLQSGNILQAIQGGISGGISLSDLISTLTSGAVPGATDLLSGLISDAATGLGIDLLPTDAIPYAGAVIKAALAAFQISEIATSNASDQDKAIAAAEIAAKTAAVLAAGPTFGASLAVTQILDFIDRLRAGQSFSQSIISANDPTAILGGQSGISGQIFYPSTAWQTFGTRLLETFQKGGTDISRLATDMQYVQSKEELGGLINSFRTWVQSDNGWPWYGQDTPDPYKIPAFPEAGGSAHEGGLNISLSDPINQIQAFIDQLLQVLPGNRVTSLGYFNQGPGVGLYNLSQSPPPQGLNQVQVAQGFSGESTNFATEIAGANLPVFVPDGAGGYQAITMNPQDVINGIAAGTLDPSPILDPRTGQWGITYTGTKGSLGFPSVSSLLSPYFQNFGQRPIPTVTLPNVSSVNLVQALAGADPNLLQSIVSPDGGGFALGGWVTGGSRGRDSVPAMLMPDEFVVPASIARENAAMLESLVSDGVYRPGSDVSAAARSGLYHSAGGVSQIALHIAEGAINISGAKDPKAVSREVLDAIEQNIRTGRLGQVIAARIRPARVGG